MESTPPKPAPQFLGKDTPLPTSPEEAVLDYVPSTSCAPTASFTCLVVISSTTEQRITTQLNGAVCAQLLQTIVVKGIEGLVMDRKGCAQDDNSVTQHTPSHHHTH